MRKFWNAIFESCVTYAKIHLHLPLQIFRLSNGPARMPRKSGGGGGAAIFRTGEAKVSKLPPTSHFWSNYPSNKIKHAGKESPELLEEKEVIWSDFIIVVYLAYFFFFFAESK